MTDITKISQKIKAAINKVGADEWQAKAGCGVIVKGSYEPSYGFASYSPVAEDVASKDLERYMVAASPANVLALLGRIAELEAERETMHSIEYVQSLLARIAELEGRWLLSARELQSHIKSIDLR